MNSRLTISYGGDLGKKDRLDRTEIECPKCKCRICTRNQLPKCPECLENIRIIKGKPHCRAVVRQSKLIQADKSVA